MDESPGDRLVERWRTATSDREQEEVCREIFVRYRGRVRYFFARRGFSPEDCQDLTQDTLIRAFQNLPCFRGDSRFETWLFQIAANRYRNALRDRSAGKRDGKEISLDTMYEPAWGPAESGHAPEEPAIDRLLREERSQRLHRAIHNLPPQMRRCVLLRIDRGMRYREIAELMLISIDTVKAHLFQARQKLKAELGDYFVDLDF